MRRTAASACGRFAVTSPWQPAVPWPHSAIRFPIVSSPPWERGTRWWMVRVRISLHAWQRHLAFSHAWMRSCSHSCWVARWRFRGFGSAGIVLELSDPA